ncbi:hypothetical protein PWT90_06337 [Aphanocladium album]|nr:hypothetical protein PWT90_06337 [Aphanocladium album]
MNSSGSPHGRREISASGIHSIDIGRRKPTIPTGIVTTRLGQLKTLTDDNGSIICYNHGDISHRGRGKGGFVIPASRSTVFLHATPPRSHIGMDSSPDESRLLRKTQSSYLKLNPDPRTYQSHDILASRTTSATTGQRDNPFEDPNNQFVKDEKIIAMLTMDEDRARHWVNGDGVQDQNSGIHICHSCGEWISFQEPCASCGHAFCSRCIADIEEHSSTSQVPTRTSEAPSSSTTFQQRSSQSDDRRAADDAENYPWSSDSRHQTTSMSSSSRSVPRAKTLSSLSMNQPARHCICCIARQPTTRRQTVAVMATTNAQTYSSSYSGSSTATHATAVSNLRLPDNVITEEALRPAALQPRRSAEPKRAVPLKTKSSDPYVGRRLLRPHPQQPEPDAEDWPKLRQVPESSNTRPHAEEDEVPWARDALRRVSKPATGEVEVYQKPTTKPEWIANLKRIKRHTGTPIATNERQHPLTPSSPLDRSKQEVVYCDRNRSVSVRPSERHASSNYDEPSCDHDPTPTKSPSLASRTSRTSLKKVDTTQTKAIYSAEAERGQPRRQPGSSGTNRPRATTLPPRDGRLPSIMKPSGRVRPRDQHSCHWRDRFMDLSAEVDQLRDELDSCEPDVAYPEREDECDDAGIDGLTVVIHLKGRDDLVINTDLRTT